jgi:hypothetical protein
MNPSEDDDTRELSEGLRLIDELQSGMAAFWRRLKAIKLSLPQHNNALNSQANFNEAE